MTEEKRPKRKYTRRPKPEAAGAYAVVVTIRRGRKQETIYAESARAEGPCLVVVSMDGPPPLLERVRYIPLGSAEITVCRRVMPAQTIPWAAYSNQPAPSQKDIEEMRAQMMAAAGPVIQPGPLELARQREAMGPGPKIVRNAPTGIVERNPDGIPVVTAGFFDGGIS